MRLLWTQNKVGEDLSRTILESMFTSSIALLYGSSNAGKSTAVHITLMNIARKVLSKN